MLCSYSPPEPLTEARSMKRTIEAVRQTVPLRHVLKHKAARLRSRRQLSKVDVGQRGGLWGDADSKVGKC